MKLADITQTLGISCDINSSEEVGILNSPENAGEKDIVFLVDPKYLSKVEKCKAKYVIVKKGTSIKGKICLEVDDPYVGYARVAQLFEDKTPIFGKGISKQAIIDPTAKIESSVSIGPGTIIGENVIIGKETIIGAGCVIEKNTTIGEKCRLDSGVIVRYNSVIGNRVIIQSGAVIGSDGFGNARENGAFIRIPAFGNVIIYDDVEIGANTTIDRGNFSSTIIGKGVKLDNLIHIAHNVVIDENTAMAAQCGVSGSTKIGKRVLVGGQAGFVGHIVIGDDAFIGAKAGVSKSVEAKSKVTGYPARDFMTMRRIEAAEQQLPSLLKEFSKLKKEIEILEKIIKEKN